MQFAGRKRGWAVRYGRVGAWVRFRRRTGRCTAPSAFCRKQESFALRMPRGRECPTADPSSARPRPAEGTVRPGRESRSCMPSGRARGAHRSRASLPRIAPRLHVYRDKGFQFRWVIDLAPPQRTVGPCFEHRKLRRVPRHTLSLMISYPHRGGRRHASTGSVTRPSFSGSAWIRLGAHKCRVRGIFQQR